MPTIQVPRHHDTRSKVFSQESFSDVNRWASGVDSSIVQIIESLKQAARLLAQITNQTTPTKSSLVPHEATHLPSGSDPLVTAAPTTILGGTSSNQKGTANAMARSDHSHDVGTAAPAFTLGTAAAEGAANELVRKDATIAAFDATVPHDLDSAAATGAATVAARRDHIHEVKAVKESGGPTLLAIGAVADGSYARRSGSSIIGEKIPFIKGATIQAPTSAEDDTLFFTNDALTITQVNAVVRGTSPSITWNLFKDSDRSASGTKVWNTAKTTTSQSTGDQFTSFDSTSIPAGSWFWFETSAASGTVNEINVTIQVVRA